MENKKKGEQTPATKKNNEAAENTWQIVKMTATWAYQLRSILLAIPVGVAAVALALRNMSALPEEVGINLLANGQFQYLIGRGVAVMGPLAVTAVCLLLMICSRKVLFPWLISIFSLVLPLVLLITNTFPA